jgi:hypothetical protein
MLKALAGPVSAPHRPSFATKAVLTIPISLSRISRCCSKNVLSTDCALVDDEAGGLVVLEDILGGGGVVFGKTRRIVNSTFANVKSALIQRG